jgi:signal transduction histidine kinase
MGVALTATNLARMRDRAEAKLVNAIERIDREILANADIKNVMLSILCTAMDITDADVSAIAIFDKEGIASDYALAKPVTGKSETGGEFGESDALRLVERYRQKSRNEIKLERQSSASFRALGLPWTKSYPSTFIPLETDGEYFGVLGVFSLDRLHYFSHSDVQKLLSMVPLIAMARKNAQLYPDLAFRESDQRNRLSLLYEVGHELRAEQGLDRVFQKVVELVSGRLRSEEAALFIFDDSSGLLEKVAVAGPDSEATLRMKAVECSYSKGVSLTGKVFEARKGMILNEIPYREDYADVYSQLLPSKKTCHYMGVPLLIGDDIFGVIRVLNKKSKDYKPHIETASLSSHGFHQDDFDLLSLISTQIVLAIRNAKSLQERVRLETLAALRRVAEKTGHDIKHDIGAVLTYATTLIEQAPTDDTRAAGEAIRQASNAALGKLQNLLMTARPVTPIFRVISFKTFLQTFEASLKGRANASRVDFCTEYPDADPLVLADPDQLRQVFANLFGNSIDAIKAARSSKGWRYGGQLDLRMADTDSHVVVEWCDNGCGIPVDVRRNLFTPLFTTKETGNGLGLFISKTIIESHHGTIDVSSRDAGVCFRIRIPLFRPSGPASGVEGAQGVQQEATA